jgi:hypothetical protein
MLARLASACMACRPEVSPEWHFVSSFCTLCAVLAPRIKSANAALSSEIWWTERNGQWPRGTKAARRHAGQQTVGSPARGHAQVKGIRDRTSWLTLLYHSTRREELCGLRIKDPHSRQGVMHFRFKGKRAKIRFVPVLATSGSPAALQLLLCSNHH